MLGTVKNKNIIGNEELKNLDASISEYFNPYSTYSGSLINI